MKIAFFFGCLVTLHGTLALARTCMPVAEMETGWIDWYAERPVADLAGPQVVLWASDTTHSWTILRYLPNGQACVLGQGVGDRPTAESDLVAALGS